MNRIDIEKRLAGEINRRGIPLELSERIAANLSGRIVDTFTVYERGSDMTYLMGAVTIAEIQARIHAKYPRVSAVDYGSYSVTANVIKLHPDWTADQVFAEVEKSFKPASAGGLLVIPKALQDKRNTTKMIAVAAIGGLLAIAFLTRKRTTVF